MSDSFGSAIIPGGGSFFSLESSFRRRFAATVDAIVCFGFCFCFCTTLLQVIGIEWLGGAGLAIMLGLEAFSLELKHKQSLCHLPSDKQHLEHTSPPQTDCIRIRCSRISGGTYSASPPCRSIRIRTGGFRSSAMSN